MSSSLKQSKMSLLCSQLYSYGNGNYGKLGHGDVKEQTVPKLVEYFAKHKIPVVDAVCGE